MTFPITDLSAIIRFAEKPNTIFIVVICVLIFIAVSVITGIIAYKLKIRKIRQNHEKDNENIQR